MKEKEELKKEIEAVLFAAGRKVSTEEIARLCKADMKDAADALAELKHDYEQKASPLLLTEESDGYKLTVREKYLSIVKEVTPHTELNRAMMETLAVIAWKQPVMQAEVIKIRTSNAYDDIRNLVEMGFISKEKHGRTFILKPTGKFFEYFDLPSREAVKEVFKDVKDVEPETQEKLDTAESAEKMGQMEVYEAPEKLEGAGEEEPREKLGGLEVFTEEEKEEAEESSEEEPGEQEEESSPEDGEPQTDEEKAREMIHKLAEEGEGSEEDEGSEEGKEDTDEADDGTEETEESGDSEDKDGKTKKKGRLPKELEEFAGIDEEEKKEEDRSEEEQEEVEKE